MGRNCCLGDGVCLNRFVNMGIFDGTFDTTINPKKGYFMNGVSRKLMAALLAGVIAAGMVQPMQSMHHVNMTMMCPAPYHHDFTNGSVSLSMSTGAIAITSVVNAF